MALFGASSAFVGIDIGTSTIKVVELIDRRKRLELTTYAEANFPNLLINSPGNGEDAVRLTANALKRVLESSHTTTDRVVAALPSSSVFSTVLTLPDLPEAELDKAVHFGARDLVPANLEDMVLGWSRLGEPPHMDTAAQKTAVPPPEPAGQSVGRANPPPNTLPAAAAGSRSAATIPVFVTAAPKAIVERYTTVSQLLKLELHAIELETFPLARSLLAQPTDSALIIDLGDQATTFHVIDRGTPRISASLDVGGHQLTEAISKALTITPAEAEQQKATQGLQENAPQPLRQAIATGLQPLLQHAKRLLETYTADSKRQITKTILIGGGANLPNISSAWSEFLGTTVTVGNPWRGLSFPGQLENRLTELGPRYAVAVGLALRGFSK